MVTNMINKKIGARIAYGTREEVADKSGYILHWSNAGWCWYIQTYRIKKGQTVRLDANQILVSGGKRVLQSVLGSLDVLPLSRNAF